MDSLFTWIPIYQELADELVKWQDRQQELIEFLENLRTKGLTITPLQDMDEDGNKFLFEEIDPFTFYGVFNRGITEDQRISIIAEIKKFFGLDREIPTDFDGIPVVHNMTSRFIGYKKGRGINDVEKLWHVFKLAIEENPFKSKEFLKAFDEAENIRGINVTLTLGLFWIRPYIFLSLDQVNRDYLKVDLPKGGLSSKFYRDLVLKISSRKSSFPEISRKAWLSQHVETQTTRLIKQDDIDYWLVGAYWHSRDPSDQTDRLVSEGVWINNYEDRYIDDVKSMNVNDKIAIKSSFTKKNDLPFDNRNKTISCMMIKAIGTIVANRGDGHTVEVEWDPDFEPKTWYFYTNRTTVWHLRKDAEPKWQEVINQLINFVWYDGSQDYDLFTNLWWGELSREPGGSESPDDYDVGVEPYSIDDIIASGVFLHKENVELILEKLSEKKSIIIQGPPGVGKTFIARKLAYALMQEKDNDRIEFIQFHQSYSYDDFIRGYRPAGEAGLFTLQNGVFFDFCTRARNDPDSEYIFIIDEINRGNLSQIFGEVLMLIERDKRGNEFSVPLVYRKDNEPRFYVPQNLYLIGLMNLADRSLAMVDYALRRRFGFIDLSPQFGSDTYSKWLSDRLMNPDLIHLIVKTMSNVNKVIREDPILGENYQIGHSYFCPRGDDFSGLDEEWYESIIRTEIIPLLKEYWFDSPSKVQDAIDNLLT